MGWTAVSKIYIFHVFRAQFYGGKGEDSLIPYLFDITSLHSIL
jgi:hypothetical protein